MNQVCCSILQCVAVCCSMFQCVAVCWWCVCGLCLQSVLSDFLHLHQRQIVILIVRGRLSVRTSQFRKSRSLLRRSCRNRDLFCGDTRLFYPLNQQQIVILIAEVFFGVARSSLVVCTRTRRYCGNRGLVCGNQRIFCRNTRLFFPLCQRHIVARRPLGVCTYMRLFFCVCIYLRLFCKDRGRGIFCVAVCCSASKCVAVCCRVVQCVAVLCKGRAREIFSGLTPLSQ
mmetsp:Transcript_3096/g.4974  ORF Transcript_3096/g.4974 Transcript_3096/m.4974 type:complete len:228 (-) Transcript_3096:173-856(-)